MAGMTSYLGWKIDYSSPPGEPAYAAPDSVQWRVFKNPIALAIGGVAAVLMEFAEPRIRSGVWDHSVYKQDPIGRSRRTGVAALVGVYGPRSAADRVIRGVTNMHQRVQGRTPSGEDYRALDPELLDWVSATAAYGFLTAYDRFVAAVSEADKSRFYREGEAVARLYGVQRTPRSTADFLAMAEALAGEFEPHPIIHEFLEIIQSGRAAPGAPRFLHKALAKAAVSVLPPIVAEKLAFGPEYRLRAWEALALKLFARLADRVAVRESAACQASVRLGLPFDFLYRGGRSQRGILAHLAVPGVQETPRTRPSSAPSS